MSRNPFKTPDAKLNRDESFTGIERLFRVLVVISTLLTVILYLLPVGDHLWLTDEQLAVASWSGWGAKVPDGEIIYWTWFSIWMTTNLGLYFYKHIARTAFAILLPFSALYQLFDGIQVLPPIDSAVASLVGTIDGVLLAIAYLTGVSRRFR